MTFFPGNGFGLKAAASAITFSESYEGSVSDPADLTTYTHASVPFVGEAGAYALLSFSSRPLTGAVPSTVTINGSINCSLMGSAVNGSQRIYIYRSDAAITSGTTISVVVVKTAGDRSNDVAAHKIVSPTLPVLSDSDSITNFSSGGATMTLDCPAGGVIVAFGTYTSIPTSFSMGALADVGRNGTLTNASGLGLGSASEEFASTQTGYTITPTFSPEVGNEAFWAGSFVAS